MSAWSRVRGPGGARLLVPEVIQTSAMDCGPAALKALLEGFGIGVSYGRLREACQTTLDGTSIDTLEHVASELGLQAEQVMISLDHLLQPEARSLPALAVVAQGDGTTHFVLLWSRIAGRVQAMDPATGRRWLAPADLLERLFRLEVQVPAAAWREYAGGEEFVAPLRARLRDLVGSGCAQRMLEQACADPGWRSLAALDACTRAVAQLARTRALVTERERERVLRSWLERAREPEGGGVIPARHWFARGAARGADGDAEQMLTLHGTAIVRVRGRLAAARDEAGRAGAEDRGSSLGAALEARSERPWRELARLLPGEARAAALGLGLATAVAAGGALMEPMILRSQLDLAHRLGSGWHPVGAALGLLLFLALLASLEAGVVLAALDLGRRLEGRLRVAFLRKVPRMHDRYLQSRPISDLAERSHMVHVIRAGPPFVLSLLRAVFRLLATAAGLVWLDPASAPRVAVTVLFSLALPPLAGRVLSERDIRVRSQAGALARFYFDALRGLLAIRTQRAEASVRAAHEGQLAEWKRASLSLLQAGIALELAVAAGSVALTGWLFLGYVERTRELAGAVLFLYWALTIPAIGREVALLSRQLPVFRSAVLRLLEPLAASESEQGGEPDAHACAAPPPQIELRGVCVQAGGHTVLHDVDLRIEPGEHVAVVGASGSGKSTLLGLLLGWHEPAVGDVRIDGRQLRGEELARLRSRTAWVDPAVQIWNRSLLENLTYGAGLDGADLGRMLADADLQDLTAALPDGLQSSLGDDGGSVSGGEGQRVRFGRALLRADAALVLLDEPFRGLDRPRRSALLDRARGIWASATLLCVTHDVAETLDFDRVIVVEHGRVREAGAPLQLAAQPRSGYARMLAAERVTREGLGSADWQHVRLESGRIAACSGSC